ncbi:MAG: hypothetical protein FWF10_09100 [Clostridiales bacterium]|nr:hypothetical protein [Clostridiales bacterium]
MQPNCEGNVEEPRKEKRRKRFLELIGIAAAEEAEEESTDLADVVREPIDVSDTAQYRARELALLEDIRVLLIDIKQDTGFFRTLALVAITLAILAGIAALIANLLH